MPSFGPYGDYVEHPRYGRGPQVTGLNEPNSSWRYGYETRIPNTGVRANKLRQNATVPLPFYYDLEKTCEDCNRRFIFFAREQQHWYEELRFPLDADCIHCVECRKSRQFDRSLKTKYDDLMSKSSGDRTWGQQLEFANLAMELIERGIFRLRNHDRIRECLNSVPEEQRHRLRYKTTSDRLQKLEQNLP